MEIVSITKEDMSQHGKVTDCNVSTVHVKISNVQDSVQSLIKSLSDNSWILKLGAVRQISDTVRSKKTVEKIVKEICAKVQNEITAEFGEYMISDTAQNVLQDNCNHQKLPLPDLFKEKKSGNGSFDFHTVSANKMLIFGESKYSSNDSPYKDAIEQINEFIKDKKDLSDLKELEFLVDNDILIAVHTQEKKSYVAAFSINAKAPSTVISNALKSSYIEPLLNYKELYLIGVEVDA